MSLENVKISIILFLLNFGRLQANELKVCLPELGCVQGTHMPGYQKGEFEAFLGIPFAEPPIGPLRFKNPEPVKPWQGLFDATRSRPSCVQKNPMFGSKSIVGEEDCLYLYVYRPENPKGLLPVMFYLHGGGFFSGSAGPAMLDPAYFMDTQEVIIVVPSYRLGPFGFLSTGSVEMPGNLGFKDQRMALKWVQANIQAFGGDPQSVTIFGHSAGAGAVHFQLLSKASSGLFNHAIFGGANALTPYIDVIRDPLQQTLKIAHQVGITNAHELPFGELVEKLQALDASMLLNAGEALKSWHYIPIFNYRATIEQEDWPDAFLTDYPKSLLEKGEVIQVPWMQSVVSYGGDGYFFTAKIGTNGDLMKEFNENFDENLWQLMDLATVGVMMEKREKIVQILVDEYFGGLREVSNGTFRTFSELFSDLGFYYPFWKAAKYSFSSSSPSNSLYFMRFSYRGPYSRAFLYSDGNQMDFGVVMQDDLTYLFRAPALFPDGFEKDSPDAKLVSEMVQLYIDFGKNGNVEGLAPCTEESFTSGGERGICDYLEIENDIEGGYRKEVHNEFNIKRMQLWEKIMENQL